MLRLTQSCKRPSYKASVSVAKLPKNLQHGFGVVPPVKPCGACTLCCSVIPVDAPELKKRSFTACPHLRGVLHTSPGCGIYSTRPAACRVWSCLWLTSPDLPDELRPDRCGVVIDPIIDLVRLNGAEKPAAQFWAAPGYELAFRDNEAVRAAIRAVGDDVPVILWRFRGDDGQQMARALVLLPGGKIGVGAAAPATADLGPEVERWARVDELMAGR